MEMAELIFGKDAKQKLREFYYQTIPLMMESRTCQEICAQSDKWWSK